MGWEAIKRRPVASQCPTVPYTATPLDTCPDSRAGRADSQPFIYHSPDAQKRRHPVTFPEIPKEMHSTPLIQGLGDQERVLTFIYVKRNKKISYPGLLYIWTAPLDVL